MAAIAMNPSASPAKPSLIKAYKNVATSIISDNLERLPGCSSIHHFHKYSGRLVGTAVTVKTRAGDNKAIHEALEIIRPGDVLVVDGEGDTSRALIGEIISSIAASRHASGLIINGALRDCDAICENSFPCYAIAANHRGPYKDGPGAINVPINIGELLISPGDIVVADLDGVVAFSQEIAESLLIKVQAQIEKEADILRSIADGTYKNAYSK